MYIKHGVTPPNSKPGEIVNILEGAETVAVVTVPLDIAKALIEVLRAVTADEALKIILPSAGEKNAR